MSDVVKVNQEGHLCSLKSQSSLFLVTELCLKCSVWHKVKHNTTLAIKVNTCHSINTFNALNFCQQRGLCVVLCCGEVGMPSWVCSAIVFPEGLPFSNRDLWWSEDLLIGFPEISACLELFWTSVIFRISDMPSRLYLSTQIQLQYLIPLISSKTINPRLVSEAFACKDPCTVTSLTLLNRRKRRSVTFPSPEREFPPERSNSHLSSEKLANQ